tara:strand:+ start:1364 stop:1597 length:234 start_codon:yes stop_codon:yes gene_type:complete
MNLEAFPARLKLGVHFSINPRRQRGTIYQEDGKMVPNKSFHWMVDGSTNGNTTWENASMVIILSAPIACEFGQRELD